MTTFTPDAAAALAGPAWLRDAAPRRPGALRGLRPAVDRGGDLALQPDRRARPRRLRRPRVATTVVTGRCPTGVEVAAAAGDADGELLGSIMDRADRRLRRAEHRLRDPDRGAGARAASSVAEPIVVEHRATVDGSAHASPGSSSRWARTPRSRWSSGSAPTTSRGLSSPSPRLARPPERPGALPRRERAGAAGLADRLAGGPRRAGLAPRCWPRSRSAATTPGSAPTPASSARAPTGDQIAVYFGEGDQMHDFRTLQDHAAPKTRSNLLFKGAVAGPRPERVHRASSGCARRPGAPTPSRRTAT